MGHKDTLLFLDDLTGTHEMRASPQEAPPEAQEPQLKTSAKDAATGCEGTPRGDGTPPTLEPALAHEPAVSVYALLGWDVVCGE